MCFSFFSFAVKLFTLKKLLSMKKIILVFACIVSLSSVKAQQGTNQIGVAADLGLPMGDFGDAFKTGFGGQVRGLFGVGTAGQITFTTGYSSFKAKGST